MKRKIIQAKSNWFVRSTGLQKRGPILLRLSEFEIVTHGDAVSVLSSVFIII